MQRCAVLCYAARLASYLEVLTPSLCRLTLRNRARLGREPCIPPSALSLAALSGSAKVFTWAFPTDIYSTMHHSSKYMFCSANSGLVPQAYTHMYTLSHICTHYQTSILISNFYTFLLPGNNLYIMLSVILTSLNKIL